MRSSRAKKFYLFIVLLGLLIVMMLFYGEFRFDWTMPQNWVVNTNNLKDPNCAKRFKEDANNKMGLTQTFYKSSVVFVAMGMIFGWPYAMHHFKTLPL